MVHHPRKINRDILEVIAHEMKTNKIIDVSKIRKVRKPSLRANLSQYFSEYCRSSGVHGIRYVGERKCFLIERLVWLVTLTVLCYFCIFLILKNFNKWKSSPVTVNFATKETPIWDIPFPAVTICPESKFDVTIFNYTNVYLKKLNRQKTTAKEDQYFNSLSLLCHNGIDVNMDLLLDYNFSKTINTSAVDDLDDLFPFDSWNMSEIFWLGREVNFDDLMTGIYTSEGVCFVFNMLNPREFLRHSKEFAKKSSSNTKSRFWSLEDGYPDDAKMDTFPKRTFMPGIDGGLNLFVFANHSHLDYLCGSSLQGYKVALHHPIELPNMEQFFRVPLDQSVLVAIKPRMITVTNELQSYTPEKRACYFAHERQLQFYKIYTQNNCFYECLSNFTLQECNCVPFYMPGNRLSPKCGPGSKACQQQTKMTYLLNEGDFLDNKTKCNCLPTCTSLAYDIEISQAEWEWRKNFMLNKRTILVNATLAEPIDEHHFSNLVVYYKDMQFLSSERRELYGMVDFFSQTGGLLGLFMGLSVTSIIEIVYFLTLRLICNIRRYGKIKWAGEQEY